MEYWREGPVCLAFNLAPFLDVWQCHLGVQRSHWGKLDAPTKSILVDFWSHHQPARIMGWVSSHNRAALAFAKRVGFVEDGEAPLLGESIIYLGWRPQWVLSEA